MDHFYQNIGEDWFTYPKLYSDMIGKYKSGAKFVEVGSWKGRSAVYMAVEILNSNYDIDFSCVDTWEGSIEHKEMDVIKSNLLYKEFLTNISPVKKYINPIRASSKEASSFFEDSSLDFVFIDASHEYEDVLEDIKYWLPKIKKGGTLAGHDYGSSGVNKAVNEYFNNSKFISTEEDCWIYEKLENNDSTENNKITLVTGLWDIKRDTLANGWSRSYDFYLDKFSELLKTPYNLIVFGDSDLRDFVWKHRNEKNTQFIERDISFFKNTEFYEKIQEIRVNDHWLAQASWLKDSTQARLELYNPLVMSKMFFLNDARLLDKFSSEHMFWVDAGITNTVHWGYFRPDTIENITSYVDRFMFVCFPYEADNEIHGFDYKEINKLAGKKVTKVARGGFFGGPVTYFDEVNSIYYNTLKSTLYDGYMGTEESVFTLMMYKHPEKFVHFDIDYDGLLYKFFDELSQKTIIPKYIDAPNKLNLDLNISNVGLYVITFNSPKQFETLIESMLNYDEDFIKKPKKILLDNSTDSSTFEKYSELCKKYQFQHIKKDNIGICGGRQYIAEDSIKNNFDFYFFFEDDMFFYNGKNNICRNGFNRVVNKIYQNSLEIVKNYGFDFLKLCYTEVFGDNGTQWAWYNVPQNIREKYWPNYSKLPEYGTDPNAPRTEFKSIRAHNGVSFISGETYYSNWPQVVSKHGNKKMFIDTKFDHPYEQTWMSHIYQEVKQGKISPGLLLASPTEHNRFDHYDGKIRREN